MYMRLYCIKNIQLVMHYFKVFKLHVKKSTILLHLFLTWQTGSVLANAIKACLFDSVQLMFIAVCDAASMFD